MKWLSPALFTLSLVVWVQPVHAKSDTKTSSGIVHIVLDSSKAGSLGAGEKLDILSSVDKMLVTEVNSGPCQSSGGNLDDQDAPSCLISRGPAMISITLVSSTEDNEDFSRELLQLLSDRYQNTRIVVHPPIRVSKRTGILPIIKETGYRLCLLSEKQKCEGSGSSDLLEAQIRIDP